MDLYSAAPDSARKRSPSSPWERLPAPAPSSPAAAFTHHTVGQKTKVPDHPEMFLRNMLYQSQYQLTLAQQQRAVLPGTVV
nr:hypothetical protein [Serratia sp. SRS-8-S-2018]